MKMFINYADILTVSDIQTMLGVGRNMAYNLVKDGKIKSLKVGSKYLIPKKCVIEFVLMESSVLLDAPEGAIIHHHGLVIDEEKEAC